MADNREDTMSRIAVFKEPEADFALPNHHERKAQAIDPQVTAEMAEFLKLTLGEAVNTEFWVSLIQALTQGNHDSGCIIPPYKIRR